MRLSNWASALSLLAFGAASARAQNNATGTLTWLQDAEPLTFQFATSDPASTNWVGLYPASGGGPVNQEHVADSLTWKYAPGAAGSVQLSTAGLQPGEYTAFFPARDGYKWLASPVNVVLAVEVEELDFIVDNATLTNARQGDEYEYRISGLVKGGGEITFSKRSCGPDWLKVSSDGVLTGVPGESATTADVLVRARRDDGSVATARFTIPVRPRGSRLVDTLSVLSFNMWHGGTRVTNYHEKQIRFLLSSKVDVVALQEDSASRRGTRRLAEALGWYYWEQPGDLGILSKYPVAEEYGIINASGGVRIALDGDEQQVKLWSVHLGYDPYGPYDFCFDNMTVARVLEREAQSGRTPQIEDTMAALEGHLAAADEVPVLLAGDFNAPSHLDWIEELKEKNCGQWNVPWPTSVLPIEAGMIDSFRVANPDPVAVPGITWSPLFPWNDDRNMPEPQDRIDFIYHKGDNLEVVSSEAVVVGEPKISPDHADNEWTTDHAAVVTVYRWVEGAASI